MPREGERKTVFCPVVSGRSSSDGEKYETSDGCCLAVGVRDRLRVGAGSDMRKQGGGQERQASCGRGQDQLPAKMQAGCLHDQGGGQEREQAQRRREEQLHDELREGRISCGVVTRAVPAPLHKEKLSGKRSPFYF